MHFINEYDVPFNFSYLKTSVGGLSGIDYDKKNDLYYLISDDRSAFNPARFYTAKIKISADKIDSVYFTGINFLTDATGSFYPSSKQNPSRTPDPEAIRFNPSKNQVTWTSEGERTVKSKENAVIENPAIYITSLTGDLIDSFSLPPNLYMHETEKGPRQNGVLEGMTFADNYKWLFVNVEEPLYEDGPRAGLTDASAFIRLYKFDAITKKNIAQYAYKLDPVARAAEPADAFKINGVPDILYAGRNKLFIIERSFSTGHANCTIKVFLAALDKATNILNNPSLSSNKNFTPVQKRLILNMDDLGIFTDNIEGVTFGPQLSNGHQSLIFVSDNNFSKEQRTQFLLFEIVPR
ncbi:MAG: hypothetical protein JWN76_3096 [Chitinophagaceae bacterium]|nr:hypothetical protein [Chitinophagaceae bacterium]